MCIDLFEFVSINVRTAWLLWKYSSLLKKFPIMAVTRLGFHFALHRALRLPLVSVVGRHLVVNFRLSCQRTWDVTFCKFRFQHFVESFQHTCATESGFPAPPPICLLMHSCRWYQRIGGSMCGKRVVTGFLVASDFFTGLQRLLLW